MAASLEPETLEAIISAAVRAATEGILRNSNADHRSIVEAAVAAATAGQQKMKKPSLPPFDPKNIDTWLRRMNAAFDRLSITDAKLKFSHIDEKIPSDTDPVINDYMCGSQTNEKWNDFVEYLRQKHGKTTKERAFAVIEGTEREGRTPTQLWSVMMDRAGKITLDDVHKEQLLKRLPSDVQRHLEAQGIEGKDGKEVAAMADVFYTKEGKLKHNSSSTGINSIRQDARPLPSALRSANASPTRSSTSTTHSSEAAGFTTPFEEDASDVNAVRFKQGQRQRFNISNGSSSNNSSQRNRSQSRGRSSNNDNNSNNRYSSNGGRFASSSNSNNSNKSNKVCYYHITHGDKAEKCEDGCMLFAKHSAAKGRASH